MQKHSFLEFCFFFYLSNFHLQHFGLFSNTFSFTRGHHTHKFIFTITVTTLHLQLISIFNHWPKTILSFTRGRHLCNFNSPGGATFSPGTNPYSWTLTDPRGGIILNKSYNSAITGTNPYAWTVSDAQRHERERLRAWRREMQHSPAALHNIVNSNK